MLKSRHIMAALLAFCVAGFGLGIVWLFQLRFNAGDIYPAYSSLRTDPLGTKAFCESLQNLPGLSVSRFFQQSYQLQGSPRRVLFFAGTDQDDLSVMSESDYKYLQDFMFSGGRIVISLLPEAGREYARRTGTNSRPWRGTPPARSKPPPRGDTNSDTPMVKMVSMFDKASLRLGYEPLVVDNSGVSHPETAMAADDASGLPPLVSWHSAIYFDGLGTNWQVVYRCRKHPVIVERSFGPGSMVLCSDSYFLSNEALRAERRAGLLGWLVGGHREIIFDETHLGVEERPGVASLMRRYHLGGVVMGLLFVAGLFVWKNSVPLVPAPPEPPPEGPSALVEGRESTAGFVSLLRRSISPSEIALTCFAEWKAACARHPRAVSRLPEIETAIEAEKVRPPASRRPVETYQTIHRILTERK